MQGLNAFYPNFPKSASKKDLSPIFFLAVPVSAISYFLISESAAFYAGMFPDYPIWKSWMIAAILEVSGVGLICWTATHRIAKYAMLFMIFCLSVLPAVLYSTKPQIDKLDQVYVSKSDQDRIATLERRAESLAKDAERLKNQKDNLAGTLREKRKVEAEILAVSQKSAKSGVSAVHQTHNWATIILLVSLRFVIQIVNWIFIGIGYTYIVSKPDLTPSDIVVSLPVSMSATPKAEHAPPDSLPEASASGSESLTHDSGVQDSENFSQDEQRIFEFIRSKGSVTRPQLHSSRKIDGGAAAYDDIITRLSARGSVVVSNANGGKLTQQIYSARGK